MFKRRNLMGAVIVVGGLMLAAGCSQGVTANDIQSDWSPTLFSTSMPFERYETMEARAIDTNSREFWEDSARIWFLDDPLNMSIYPIP